MMQQQLLPKLSDEALVMIGECREHCCVERLVIGDVRRTWGFCLLFPAPFLVPSVMWRIKRKTKLGFMGRFRKKEKYGDVLELKAQGV